MASMECWKKIAESRTPRETSKGPISLMTATESTIIEIYGMYLDI